MIKAPAGKMPAGALIQRNKLGVVTYKFLADSLFIQNNSLRHYPYVVKDNRFNIFRLYEM